MSKDKKETKKEVKKEEQKGQKLPTAEVYKNTVRNYLQKTHVKQVLEQEHAKVLRELAALEGAMVFAEQTGEYRREAVIAELGMEARAQQEAQNAKK